ARDYLRERLPRLFSATDFRRRFVVLQAYGILKARGVSFPELDTHVSAVLRFGDVPLIEHLARWIQAPGPKRTSHILLQDPAWRMSQPMALDQLGSLVLDEYLLRMGEYVVLINRERRLWDAAQIDYPSHVARHLADHERLLRIRSRDEWDEEVE